MIQFDKKDIDAIIDDIDEDELDRTVSDLHKDAYGCRPAESFWKEWDSYSPLQKHAIYGIMMSHITND
jgi:hypothetical protein